MIPLVTSGYWLEILAIKDDPRSLRINGHHYWATDKPSGSFFPFNGKVFSMRRISDGAPLQTMMWDNAPIPDFLKEVLPDNYVFA